MFTLKSMTVRRIGDSYGRDSLDYLETEWDGQHIIKSMRYSDDDIKTEGVEKVRQWIELNWQTILK